MVDALASGASIRKDVEVRVLSWAPIFDEYIIIIYTYTLEVSHYWGCSGKVGRFCSRNGLLILSSGTLTRSTILGLGRLSHDHFTSVV